jgi:hypothetical protein
MVGSATFLTGGITRAVGDVVESRAMRARRERPVLKHYLGYGSSASQLCGGVCFVVGTGVLYPTADGFLIANVVLYMVGAAVSPAPSCWRSAGRETLRGDAQVGTFKS